VATESASRQTTSCRNRSSLPVPTDPCAPRRDPAAGTDAARCEDVGPWARLTGAPKPVEGSAIEFAQITAASSRKLSRRCIAANAIATSWTRGRVDVHIERCPAVGTGRALSGRHSEQLIGRAHIRKIFSALSGARGTSSPKSLRSPDTSQHQRSRAQDEVAGSGNLEGMQLVRDLRCNAHRGHTVHHRSPGRRFRPSTGPTISGPAGGSRGLPFATQLPS